MKWRIFLCMFGCLFFEQLNAQQPQYRAPWFGKEQISQANLGSTSHNTCGNRTLDPTNCLWENTYALDIPKSVGLPVLASQNGIVAHYDDDPNGLGGREVGIDHGNENYSTYMHLSKVFVKEGEYVKQGQVIALMGNSSQGDGGTSAHLHFHLYSGTGSWNSHTVPFEDLILKRDGVDNDFTSYDSRIGELNSSAISWQNFWSNNTSLFDAVFSSSGGQSAFGETIELSEYGWWDTWSGTDFSNVYLTHPNQTITGGTLSNPHLVYDPMRGAKNVVLCFSQMYDKWATLGGPNSSLGSPLASRYQKGSLWYQDFQGRLISLDGSTATASNYPNSYGPGAFNYATQSGETGMMIEQIPGGSPVVGWSPVASYLFAECYKRNGQSGVVGYPAVSFNGSAVSANVSRWNIPNSSDFFYVQYFSGGSLGECMMMYDPKNGSSPVKDNKHLACLVKSGFKTWYLANNGISVLGAPLSDEYQSGNYTVQDFQKGYLIWTGSSVAVEFFVGAAAIATKQVSFTSSPTGASMWDRGRLIGVAPITDYLFQGATYTVTAKLSGYQEKEATFVVNSDMSVNIDLTQTSPLTVTYPNSGETLADGSTHQLTWSGGSFSVAKIEVSRDNGATWSIITSGTSNSDHYFNWQSSGSISAKCRIKISDAYNPSVFDVSDGTFTYGNVSGSKLAASVSDLGPIYSHAGDSAVVTFNILDIGTGDSLHWTISWASGIQEVDPDTGYGNRNVGVALNFTGKAVGSYEDNITISSNGGTKVIPVRYTIDPPGTSVAFADGFNRTSVGSDWATSGTASIYNGELELSASSGNAKAICASAGNLKHASVEFDLGQRSGGGNQMTGIYFQRVDSLNYAEIVIQLSNSTISMARHVQGQTSVQTSFSYAIQPGKYLASVFDDTLKFKNLSGGTSVNVSWVNRSIPSLAAGKIGFYVGEDTRKFDNVVVRNLPFYSLTLPAPKYIGNGESGTLSDSLLFTNVGNMTVTGAVTLTGSLAMDSSIVHLTAGQSRKYKVTANLTSASVGSKNDTVKISYNGKVSKAVVRYTKLSIVGLWKMDGALASTVKKKNEVTAVSVTESGVGSTADHYGVADAAYSFNGASYLQTDVNSQLDGITKLSVEAWVKTTSTTHDQIMGRWESNAHNFILNWFNNSSVFVYIASSPTDGGGNSNASMSVSRDQNWHLISFVYDGTLANSDRIKMYWDGQPQTVTTTGTIPTALTSVGSGNPFIIGNFEPSTSGPPHSGAIDYVRMQNIALSSDDILYSYQGYLPGGGGSSGGGGSDPASVIGHWKMAGAVGSTAKKKNETTSASLTESGMSSTTDHKSVADEAYSFSGSGYLVTDLSTQLDGLSKLTVEGWIKTTSSTHDQMIGRWGSNAHSFILNWFNDSRVFVYIASSPTDGGGNSNVSMTVTRDQSWHYIAFVYDGSLGNADRVKLYWDGTAQTTTVTGAIPTTLTTVGSTAMIIGNYEAGTGGPNHTGAMDWVRVSNTALSASEISASYQATLKIAAPNVMESASLIPEVFHLYQNHPNPFNPITTIRFDIPERTHATLTIFNIVGQKVATLLDGNVEPGFRSVKWDASRFSSGIYFYVLNTSAYHAVRKMAVVK